MNLKLKRNKKVDLNLIQNQLVLKVNQMYLIQHLKILINFQRKSKNKLQNNNQINSNLFVLKMKVMNQLMTFKST